MKQLLITAKHGQNQLSRAVLAGDGNAATRTRSCQVL
jgi:hypothetical protein